MTRYQLPSPADRGGRMKYPNARRLLKAELEYLKNDHYADGKPHGCTLCRKATAVRRELDNLSKET